MVGLVEVQPCTGALPTLSKPTTGACAHRPVSRNSSAGPDKLLQLPSRRGHGAGRNELDEQVDERGELQLPTRAGRQAAAAIVSLGHSEQRAQPSG